MLKWLEKLAEGNKHGDILLFVSRDYEMVGAAVALRMSNRCKIIFSTKNHPIAITLEQYVVFMYLARMYKYYYLILVYVAVCECIAKGIRNVLVLHIRISKTDYLLAFLWALFLAGNCLCSL